MYKNVVVIGANGALGTTFINKFLTYATLENIFVFSREPFKHEDKRVTSNLIDYEKEDSIAAAAEKVPDGHVIDAIIVATGMLHNDSISPEKSLKELNATNMHHLFAANTILPALIAKHFLGKLVLDRKSIFTAMSARVGSISDNSLGGWFSYRASKAALNMTIKNIAVEFCRFHKKAVIVGLHPGTVDSYLSEPYKKRIAADKLFSPDYAVDMLLDVLDKLCPEDSGWCYAYDGSKIEP
ncbi:MAG: SDR family NAD(P)-dependent oxidoreductase [Pseudomonadota bacterium]|nr:SDR family NAD(P)-dependent oxidoreductase [Pseudomonadota bacterium]